MALGTLFKLIGLDAVVFHPKGILYCTHTYESFCPQFFPWVWRTTTQNLEPSWKVLEIPASISVEETPVLKLISHFNPAQKLCEYPTLQPSWACFWDEEYFIS